MLRTIFLIFGIGVVLFMRLRRLWVGNLPIREAIRDSEFRLFIRADFVEENKCLNMFAFIVKFDALLETVVTTLIFVFIGLVFFALAFGSSAKPRRFRFARKSKKTKTPRSASSSARF